MALEVVAGVDDDGQPIAEVGLEPVGELGPADAAGERDDRAAAEPGSGIREERVDLADPLDRLEVVRRRAAGRSPC